MTTQKLLPLLGAVALLSSVPMLACARTHVFLGINLGGLFAPPPVVYAAPPVAYPAPPPVVYVPRPRYDYYSAPVYYGEPVYIERRGWRRHEHWDHDHGDYGRRHGWHHDHGDDDDDEQ